MAFFNGGVAELLVHNYGVPYVIGSYTGDGKYNRAIALGCTPSAVLIFTEDMSKNEDSVALPLNGGFVKQGEAVKHIGIDLVKLNGSTLTVTEWTFTPAGGATEDMYQVSYNKSGTEYKYIAFRGENGFAPETEKEWVKVATITLENDVPQIEPTFPADTYKELFIRGTYYISRDDGASGTPAISLGNVKGNSAYSKINTASASGQKYLFTAEGNLAADGVPTYRLSNGTSSFTGATDATNVGAMAGSGKEYLPEFSLYISNDGFYFAANSTFEIWGR